MWIKFKIWIEGMGTIAKTIASFASLVSLLIGGIMIHDANVIKRYNEEQEKRIKDQTNQYTAIKIDTLTNVFNRYMGTQKEFNVMASEQLESVINKQDKLKAYLINNAPTKDELKEIIKVFEDEKKNYNSYRDTVGKREFKIGIYKTDKK